jgi:hypothetical protein
VLPPNAAALAPELAQRGWSPHALRAWLEDHLPELRQAAQRSGGDPAALLVWRLKNAVRPPSPEAEAPEPLPPPRPLSPQEQACWETALARARQDLPGPAQEALSGMEPLGVVEQPGRMALVVQVRGTAAASRLVFTRTFRNALFEAFGRSVEIIPKLYEEPTE